MLLLAFSISAQVLRAAPQPPGVALAWNPSSTADVSGYRVYLGGSSGVYTNVLDAGNATIITLSDLMAGASYFFAITAYDAGGNESDFSNELVVTPAVATHPEIATLKLRTAAAGGMMLTVTGPAGRTYDLLASSDLQDWVVISVVSLNAGGQFDFTDPDAANHPARFYRARETQPSVQLRLAPDSHAIVSVTGQNGRMYDVQASSDLADWTVIGAVTLGESGGLDFVDADAANYPARFYRTRERQP